MNSTDLIKNFIRVEKSVDRVRILVCTIDWPHPHTPTSKWEVVEVLHQEAGQDVVGDAIAGILQNKKYFSVCEECNERNPVGHMHDEKICMGCAQQNHGVCY